MDMDKQLYRKWAILYIIHDSGRTKEPVKAAKKRFESMYFGQNVKTLNKSSSNSLNNLRNRYVVT